MRADSKKTNFTILLITIYLLSWAAHVSAQSDPIYEYKIKAVFIYQFVNFIDGWEFKNNDANDNKPFVIGIIGQNPFGEDFEPLKEKLIKNKKVSFRYFKGFSELIKEDKVREIHPDIEKIQECHVVFVCDSELLYLDYILAPIRSKNILTIGDAPGFIEKGGIINFIIEKNKVRFNINLASAKLARLSIRAKLLRLAKEVTE